MSRIRGADIVFLVFTGQHPGPEMVVKVSPSVDRNRFLEHQYATVTANRERLSPGMRETVPAAHYGDYLDGRFVFIQSGLQGAGIPRDVGYCRYPTRRRRLEGAIRRAGRWLVAFQRETYSGHVPLTGELLCNEILMPLSRFRETHHVSGDEIEYLNELSAAFARRGSVRLPQVSTHGDFYIENCLFDGDAVKVFDWSYSQAAALPLWDAFLFAATLHVREREDEHWVEPPHVLLRDHPLRPALVRLLRSVACAWSIDPDLLPYYFGVFLARMATRTPDEFGSHAGRNAQWRRAFAAYVARRQMCWR